MEKLAHTLIRHFRVFVYSQQCYVHEVFVLSNQGLSKAYQWHLVLSDQTSRQLTGWHSVTKASFNLNLLFPVLYTRQTLQKKELSHDQSE